MVCAVHHITINVNNLEDSLKFYGELLGLKRLPNVEMPDHVLYYFELPGAMKLELIDYLFETGLTEQARTDKGSYRHIALQCSDVSSITERIAAYKGKVLQQLRYVEALGFAGALVEDSNGCEIEFILL